MLMLKHDFGKSDSHSYAKYLIYEIHVCVCIHLELHLGMKCAVMDKQISDLMFMISWIITFLYIWLLKIR